MPTPDIKCRICSNFAMISYSCGNGMDCTCNFPRCGLCTNGHLYTENIDPKPESGRNINKEEKNKITYKDKTQDIYDNYHNLNSKSKSLLFSFYGIYKL